MTAAVDGAPRLDLWLAQHRGLSRSAARTLLDAGLVRVNGRAARAGQRVRPGDAVDVDEPLPSLPPPAAAAGPHVDLRIVHEDEHLAVIDKPAGLVVHPAPGHPAGTLADGLRQRGDTWSHLGGVERPGIVHRLDRFTSGLLVVAKTEAAHRRLAAQLADRSLGRTYWALVWGGVSESTGRIEAPIGRDPRHRQRMAVIDEGREAVTEFTVTERLPHTTTLQATLRTGRTHQIRVHLAWVGRPLVGDPLYGRRDDPARGRPALHAMRLRFVHPASGEHCSFESPLPPDLAELLARARADTL